MARVRYPFIVRFTALDNQGVTYAKEGAGPFDFERVDEILDATVYTGPKMFKKLYEKSPTAYLRDFNEIDWRQNDVALIYVGDAA